MTTQIIFRDRDELVTAIREENEIEQLRNQIVQLERQVAAMRQQLQDAGDMTD